MKPVLAVFIAIFCLGCTQAVRNGNENLKTDTTFLVRELNDSFYHAVYIEKNRSHPFYDSVLNSFRLFADEQKGWMYLRRMKNIRHVPTLGLPEDWILLNSYQNKYYVYYGLSRTFVTDSVWGTWYFETDPFPITRISKKGSHWTVHYTGEKGTDELLNIYMIDTVRQIAIWEYGQPKTFELRIPRERAKEYDLVVNHCLTEETDDYVFDTLPLSSWVKKLPK